MLLYYGATVEYSAALTSLSGNAFPYICRLFVYNCLFVD